MQSDILLIAAMILLSAYFSGSEVALFSLSRPELHRMASSAKKRERLLGELMASPQKILVTILVGNLLANLLIPAVSTRILLENWPAYGHLIAIAVVTPLIIILCDITPKTITRSNPPRFSRYMVAPLYFFHLLFYPVRQIILAVNGFIIRAFRLTGEDRRITREDLDAAVKVGEMEGVIRQEEGDFLKNVLRFSKKQALNVMIPRNQAVFIPYGSSIGDAAKSFRESGLVRALVYRGDLDNVVGVLDSRRLIPYVWGYKKARSINRLLISVYHYPSTKELGELLGDFLEKKINIAVVMDEYGGTAGVVTLNAILSELLGREFSSSEEIYKPDVRKIGDDTIVINGDMQIDDFNLEFGETIESSESETMGGYVIERIGRIPRKDEWIETRMFRLKVRRVVKHRIEAIEVIPGRGRQ